MIPVNIGSGSVLLPSGNKSVTKYHGVARPQWVNWLKHEDMDINREQAQWVERQLATWHAPDS